ncbi:MAG: Rieske (2Fe-2S) protein [Sphingomonadaceae bacterium]|nr:Rieske (2Fe-2S) protein [Sphingomonadaceae bacterium]
MNSAAIGLDRLEHSQVCDADAELVIPGDGENGFPMCWYAVCKSSDVPDGLIFETPFLGGNVVVWRSTRGRLNVQTAYCAHMGANLANGRIVGETIECGFHHWCYDTGGKCVYIPSTDNIPAKARLFSYPTVETQGLIWAFNGAEPDLDIPLPLTVDNIDDYWIAVQDDVHEMQLPHYAQMLNIVDFQHFQYVHDMAMTDGFPPKDAVLTIDDHSFGFSYKWGEVDTHWRMTGTSILNITFEGPGALFELVNLMATTPIPGGRHKVYGVGFKRKRADTPEDRARADAEWVATKPMEDATFKQDEDVMRDWHLRARNLVPADVWQRRMLEFIRDYPRADPAEGYQ